MGLWSLYFLGKLYLYFRGYLQIDFVLNLAFLALLAIPLPRGWKPRASLRRARLFAGAAIALLLLWHDSYLPTLTDTFVFLRQDGLPSKEYLLRFTLGFLNPVEAAALAFLLLAATLIRKHVRLTAVVVALLLLVPLRSLGHPDKGTIERDVDAFYRAEAERVLRFDPVSGGAHPFDVIILHVCSLSWDDLRAVGMADDPFLNRFDVLFTDFNTVTSYSNPAALRLLRANCGQMRHDELYAVVPKECDLFDALRAAGYRTYFTMNHDGTYSDFSRQVGTLAHLDPPLLPAGLPVAEKNFDGAPLADDYAVLERWWETRRTSGAARAAVYYNTISLHDGAHRADDADWWKRDRNDLYRERVQKLFSDVTRFVDRVAASERSAMVLFVPEHGMALRGTAIQAGGLRDIPLPNITIVPVGVKWVGDAFRVLQDHPRVISKPTSYMALSSLIAATLKQTATPFALGEALDGVPETAFLSENQRVRIEKAGGAYFMYGKEKKWTPLSIDALNR